MQVSESFRIAVSTLNAHKVRSLLTVLGTVIGVMSVVAIVSIIEGMNKYVSEKLVSEGSNTFFIDQFGLITDYEEYLKALESAPKSERFLPTYEWFKSDFERLSHDVHMDADWAESMLTWSNILTHRASLA